MLMPRSYASKVRTERPSRGAPSRIRPLLPQPLVDRRGVGVDPLLPCLVRVHVVAGDPLGNRLLVRVRPLEPLQDAVRGRAAVRELLAEHLVQDDRVVRALVLRDAPARLGVVLTPLEPRR